MLEYENQAFLEIVDEDGLLVMAKGLGLEKLFLNLLKIYSDPGNLVLVLGTTQREEKYFLSELEKEGKTSSTTFQMPKIISAECNTNDRHGIYMKGGVLFVTSRIFVVDLLTERVPIELITGILVYRAHRVVEFGQEAFIMRLFRQKNKVGFIKAFSESPNAFLANFCQVERTMRHLFVRKLYLWPRFHAIINSTLERHKPDVVEIHVELTPSMLSMQTSILSLVSTCIKELKQCNPNIDSDEFTVESIVSGKFEKLVRVNLESIWNQLSSKTKQLVADLRILSNILRSLTQSDCVSFYNLIHSLRASEQTFHESNWLFLDSAQSLYLKAKERVFGREDFKAKEGENSGVSNKNKDSELKFEEHPKWTVLSDILREIRNARGTNSELLAPHILVLAFDEFTCNQIREYLCKGAKSCLQRLLDKTLDARNSKRSKLSTSEESKKISDEQTLTQMYKSDSKGKTEALIPEAFEDLSDCCIFVEPIKVVSEPFHVSLLLDELEPEFVIMYDASVQCVRQLEVYKANNPTKSLTVYFLIFGGSVEEQKYLTSLRKEKEAFETLIKEKATMVIPEERDGKTGDHPDLNRDPIKANQECTGSTRKGDKSKLLTKEEPRILVDMREFSSSLPSVIHRKGINIIPLTLEVGDYILTPDICVERKSLSDLIGSLNSGRLYNQAVAMLRTYKQPILLIEFDEKKGFGLIGKNPLSADISSQDISTRLALLTMHFPQLRILWCVSAYATAELFHELKMNKDEPSIEKAMAANADSEFAVQLKYNAAPQDFLTKLPGISSKNYFGLANKIENIAELAKLTLEDIEKIMQNSADAKNLWDSIHVSIEQLGKAPVEEPKPKRFKRSTKVKGKK